ncbi:MAG TPA: hypothetical protein V6C78_27645 [Crinalium sp.]
MTKFKAAVLILKPITSFAPPMGGKTHNRRQRKPAAGGLALPSICIVRIAEI